MDTQKTNEKTRLMFTLQYSLERYQAMGNGPKCQEIQRELNALKRGTKNAWTLEGAESVGLFGEGLHFQYSKITKNELFPYFFIWPLRFEVFPERSGQCFMASNRFLVPFRFQDSEDLPVNVAPLRENLKKHRFHRKKWQQYEGRAFSNRKTALLNSSWRLIFPLPNVKDSRATRVFALHTYTFFKAYLHSLQILHKANLTFENQCG